ncbi:unnamed protein product [Owenia fusiformis]|uniref:Uncharacterized protein n=1 Tax=Owenia fusiformis TaxID=6347 RepID=A0A8S4PVI0_OWEFU|nr:unnamed protein product [Owenia fusiformis]
MPSAFYGAELWYDISKTEMNEMEIAQKYVVKRFQGFEKRTPSVMAISSMGIWTISSFISKMKFLFLGRLLRSNRNSTQKQMFLCRLSSLISRECQFKVNKGFLQDLKNLNLPALFETITNYIDHGIYIQSKDIWKFVVIEEIQTQQKRQWVHDLSQDSKYLRFANTHVDYEPIIHWKLGIMDPSRLWEYAQLLYLMVLSTQEEQYCLACAKTTNDIVKHFILECSSLSATRDIFFEKIVNLLPVEDSINILNSDDDVLVECLLGSRTDVLQNYDFAEWQQFINLSSNQISAMLKEFTS